ncbi:hypothetical protein EJ05DRAFT_332076 [Pseudovirgaria hyperparasitica]|uniref:Uncharacterized protein n=1 Tax=Pseudovirgaria hyperparasitica TaxID=470096 RepID=A0A6A6WA82_9PEZI|nr:uncharacterized protein EJ05DRAFT_332076 [Pseudovirgaria hyperparasitica]KAF2759079.1 hypothetical protein EJ05DRAFT_332076 [Pseudovirgaria hyperparasitica]
MTKLLDRTQILCSYREWRNTRTLRRLREKGRLWPGRRRPSARLSGFFSYPSQQYRTCHGIYLLSRYTIQIVASGSYSRLRRDTGSAVHVNRFKGAA